MEIKPITKFNRVMTVAPDKSITHRAIMFNSFAQGRAVISNSLLGQDCLSTIECMRRLGANIQLCRDKVIIEGVKQLKDACLFVGNSGTTMRLLTGLLSGVAGHFILDGDISLRSRPMNRVVVPLKEMGANIVCQDEKAPIKIFPSSLNGIDYKMPVASAQVKSAILLAVINAEGQTIVRETIPSRNHSEIMLSQMGANITVNGKDIIITKSNLYCVDVTVPNDISSAVYPLVLACIIKNACVTIKNVSLNPTRTGIIDVFKDCGCKIDIELTHTKGEMCGNITLKQTQLKPFVIDKTLIPRLIDEIPTLAVLACFIEGTSIISGAQELKVKESNRIDSTVKCLKLMGADIEGTMDGMIIHGKGYLDGGVTIDSYGDHRIAMSMAVAGWGSKKGINILNANCVDISYPNFYNIVEV